MPTFFVKIFDNEHDIRFFARINTLPNYSLYLKPKSLDWSIYVLVIFAGILAGIINTLAGNGSAVTLTLLSYLGLPTNIANGTNRVGIVFQSLIGYRTYHKSKLVNTEGSLWLIVPAVLGALIGASVVVQLSEDWLNTFLGGLMIVLLILVLFNPKKWLAEQEPNFQQMRSWKSMLTLFLVGFHGGFIQAGVGVLLLAALVLNVGYSLRKANGIKLLIVITFAIPVLGMFIYHEQIDWFWAIPLTIGQSIGGWLAARFATNYPNANIWIRRLLIVVIIGAIIKFLGLYNFFI